MIHYPGGVASAVQALIVDGYTGNIETSINVAGPEPLRANTAAIACEHPIDNITQERVYRFEGASNPDDSSIVIGLRCRCCDDTGIVVSAYGPAADPKLFEVLKKMSTSRAAHDPMP